MSLGGRGQSVGDRARATLERLRRGRAERHLGDRTDREVIAAYFDRELPPEEAQALFRAIRMDAEAAEEFQQTQRALDALRAPTRGPDLSQSILAEVGRRRGGWLSDRSRRIVTLGRFAVAASLLLVATGAFVADRLSPGALDLSDRQTPLASLVEEGRTSTREGLQQVRASVRAVGAYASAPARQAGGEGDCSELGLIEGVIAQRTVDKGCDSSRKVLLLRFSEGVRLSGGFPLGADIRIERSRDGKKQSVTVETLFTPCNGPDKATAPPFPLRPGESDG